MRSATAEGLVALNEIGEVVPAMAERWIVTDDGLSYIFRLRNSEWSDGTTITSQNAVQSIVRNIDQLQGTSLGVDLDIISDIRAMTGRVIEFRLKSPMPQFLQLIAQPELGLRKDGVGNGPMTIEQGEDSITLSVLPPERRGLPRREEWQEDFRQIEVVSVSAGSAAALFEAGEADAVFNGSLLNLALVETGPLSSGTLRLDGVFGLFGLRITNSSGFLDDAPLREAVAMGIDRDTLLQPFNLGGWVPTTRIVPAELPNTASAVTERWADMSFEERRAEAKRRVIAWRAQNLSVEATLSLSLPDSPGSDILFTELESDFDAIGIVLTRVGASERADLVLIDTLARYADKRWFLNQFNCTLDAGLCSPEADALVLDSMSETNPQLSAQLLAEAEQELLASQAYIPIGAPVRWSLIRGGVDGFVENSWGLHPLFPMASRPN
ncbi:peptide ABC transporter substrate-binding protein [Altererythrobacter aestiaquae]|uniref:Peptide ABC transporter substrate-binding protein n=1 Tax=Pontixanthobacter aestiaquae TaxID=1509367 RepID=A0A844Z3T2_9SPHN|nr:peptide ABC transporter substrate-binding protein [Pontixanthobacter aestiaquae]